LKLQIDLLNMVTTAYIGIGSNIGDSKCQIIKALISLAESRGIQLKGVSTLVQTKPVGPVEQPDFINAVAEVETTLKPLALLDRLQVIEEGLGRRRSQRWGPRTIDLDILYYGDQAINHSRLNVPHPEIGNRPFVVSALRELGHG
jgi:2-amino-4-hydroxy-6-hydroxymethyldihydropteridine diphosphokinase